MLSGRYGNLVELIVEGDLLFITRVTLLAVKLILLTARDFGVDIIMMLLSDFFTN